MKKGDLKNQKNQRKSPNIFKKMFLSFIIVPIIPILALLYLNYKAQLEQEAFVESNLMNISTLIGAEIDKSLEQTVNLSMLTAQLEDVQSMDPARQAPILKAIKQNSEKIVSARIDDRDGMSIARSDNKPLKNYADRNYFQQVKSGEEIGQEIVFGKITKQPLLCFAVSIDNEEQVFLGTLTQCALLEGIINIVKSVSVGNTGFAFLVDRNNQLITTSGGAENENIASQLTDMSSHPALQDDNANEVFNYQDTSSGQPVLAYRVKAGLGWSLVVQQPYSEAFAASTQARNGAILAALLTALACFVIIYFMSKIISKPIQEARKETDNILSATSDGLFLIDADYTIGNQHSSNLSSILQKNNPSGTSFIRYLNDSVPVSVAQMARDYIELLFTPRIKEELVQSRNPLKVVQTSVENRSGELESKYLSLTFKRVFEKDKIAHLFVTAKDITKEILLQKELEKVKEDKDEQVGLLTDILYIPSDELNAFLSQADKVLNNINGILEQPGSDVSEYRAKIDNMFQLIHKIKGDASAINFSLFSNECHGFEEILSKMKVQRTNLTGNEFLPLTLALEGLFKKCNMVDELLDKIGAFSNTQDGVLKNGVSTVGSEKELSNLQKWQQLKGLAENVAHKNNKSVELHFRGFNINLSDKYTSSLRDIFIQLIRNSIVHGLELPSLRRQQGKIEDGQIVISIRHSKDYGYSITYSDDGQGIDYARVKEKIISSGIATLDEVENFTEEQLLRVIFKSGFSSKEEADIDAGRGVGLSLVLDKVKELGGRIRLSSIIGKRITFRIVLPNISELDT